MSSSCSPRGGLTVVMATSSTERRGRSQPAERWRYADAPLVDTIRHNQALQRYEDTHRREAHTLNVNRSAMARGARLTDESLVREIVSMLTRSRRDKEAASRTGNLPYTASLPRTKCRPVDEAQTYQFPFYKRYAESKLQQARENSSLLQRRAQLDLNVTSARCPHRYASGSPNKERDESPDAGEYVIFPVVTSRYSDSGEYDMDLESTSESYSTYGSSTPRASLSDNDWSLPAIGIGDWPTAGLRHGAVDEALGLPRIHLEPMLLTAKQQRKRRTVRVGSHEGTGASRDDRTTRREVEDKVTVELPALKNVRKSAKTRRDKTKKRNQTNRNNSSNRAPILLIKSTFPHYTPSADRDVDRSRLSTYTPQERRSTNEKGKYDPRSSSSAQRQPRSRGKRGRRRASAKRRHGSIRRWSLCVVGLPHATVASRRHRGRSRRDVTTEDDDGPRLETRHCGDDVIDDEQQTALERRTTTFIHVKIPTGSSIIVKSSLRQARKRSDVKKVVQFGAEYIHEVSKIEYHDESSSVMDDDVGDIAQLSEDDDDIAQLIEDDDIVHLSEDDDIVQLSEDDDDDDIVQLSEDDNDD